MFHSAFFRHENRVHITQQSWVITFAVDITQYEEGLHTLRNAYTTLVSQMNELEPVPVPESAANRSSTLIYQTLLDHQTAQANELAALFESCNRRYHALHALYLAATARTKRSLLPFVGDILGV